MTANGFRPIRCSVKSINRKAISRDVCLATGLSYADVDVVVKEALETIARHLAEGSCVRMNSLGTFEFRERLSRIKFNPNNIEDKVLVPQHFAVVFNPAEKLKLAVRKLKEVTVTRMTFGSRKRHPESAGLSDTEVT